MRPASRLQRSSHLGIVAITALAVVVAGLVPGLLGPQALRDRAAAAEIGNIAPVEEAASWLSDQLVGGLINDPAETGGEYYDPSVDAAIDAALAFQGIVDYDSVVTEIRMGVVATTHDFAHPVTEVLNRRAPRTASTACSPSTAWTALCSGCWTARRSRSGSSSAPFAAARSRRSWSRASPR